MNKPYGSKQEDELGEVILAIAGQLSGADLKVADYVRLMQLKDDLMNDEFNRVKAGWVSKC